VSGATFAGAAAAARAAGTHLADAIDVPALSFVARHDV
jgi:hypothetical protein